MFMFHRKPGINVLFFLFVVAATPKQIREHMKVDGLTNDEVKSHLQVRIWDFVPFFFLLLIKLTQMSINFI